MMLPPRLSAKRDERAGFLTSFKLVFPRRVPHTGLVKASSIRVIVDGDAVSRQTWPRLLQRQIQHMGKTGEMRAHLVLGLEGHWRHGSPNGKEFLRRKADAKSRVALNRFAWESLPIWYMEIQWSNGNRVGPI